MRKIRQAKLTSKYHKNGYNTILEDLFAEDTPKTSSFFEHRNPKLRLKDRLNQKIYIKGIL
jgi:hypothetical protein